MNKKFQRIFKSCELALLDVGIADCPRHRKNFTLTKAKTLSYAIQPRIETVIEKKLVGIKMQMSLGDNKTAELWKGFMSRRKEIANARATKMISLQIYDPSYFMNFNPANKFEKWAAVEVNDFHKVPEGFQTMTLHGGLYAVFHYEGSSNDKRIFQYIFQTWLPDSNFLLDERPHFEILGERYKNNDPSSEEDIFIPVKPKSVATAFPSASG